MNLPEKRFRQPEGHILCDLILILRKLYINLRIINISHALFYKCFSIPLFQIYSVGIALTVEENIFFNVLTLYD